MRPIYQPYLLGQLYDWLYEADGLTTATPDLESLKGLLATCFAGTDKDAAPQIKKMRAMSSGKRLLEVGSSWGYFLYQAQAAGFEATGLEIGAGRRDFGRKHLGVQIVSDWSELGENQQFDVIYCAHVLEHFIDLSTIFDTLKRHLAPDGWLCAEVPNFDYRKIDELTSIMGAVHPLGFNAPFFTRNLPKHGFKVLGTYGGWANAPQNHAEWPKEDTIVILAKHATQGLSS